MSLPELHGLCYSPWTEKARWALDHHRIAYRYKEHVVLLDEPMLRWKLRRSSITVPAWVSDDARLIDSIEIARHADSIGSGSALFPAGKEEDIRKINAIGESALDAERALNTPRMAADEGFRRDSLPPWIPGAIWKAANPVVSLALAYVNREFGNDDRKRAEAGATVRESLTALRKALAAGGGSYVLGEFTFADVAAAVALQGIWPVANPYVPLKASARRCLSHPDFRSEFQDLIDWRDRIYGKHRAAHH